MSHPDIELLHTWLDGELAPPEAAALEAHIGSCPACAALVREQRGLLTEAEALLAELDHPIPRSTDAAPRAAGSSHPAEWGTPEVLLPYHAPERSWRRILLPGMGIAATLLVAVGAGWLALRPEMSSTRRPADSQSSSSVGTVPPPPAPVDSGPVTSEIRNESPAPATARAPASAPAPVRRDEARAAGVLSTPEKVARDAPVLAQRSAPDTGLGIPRETPMAAPKQVPALEAASSAAVPLTRTEPQRVAELKAADEREPLADALDAQITTRIGLDEASQQLGGKLHVIDGMRAELVGLVPGRLVPGADSSRPVVRVVYLGDDGRRIFLDQQRIAVDGGNRQARAATIPGTWLDGDVRLRLHGALSKDSLAELARRVR